MNQSRIKKFNQIKIGGKFKTFSEITYQKISKKRARPLLTSNGEKINSETSTARFYNNKIKIIEIS